MLGLFTALALAAHRMRVALRLGAAAGGALFGAGLVWPSRSDNYLLASLLLFLWAAFLLAFSACFRRRPPTAVPGEARFARIKTKLRRGLLWVLGAVAAAVFVFLLFLSLRLIGVMAGNA